MNIKAKPCMIYNFAGRFYHRLWCLYYIFFGRINPFTAFYHEDHLHSLCFDVEIKTYTKCLNHYKIAKNTGHAYDRPYKFKTNSHNPKEDIAFHITERHLADCYASYNLYVVGIYSGLAAGIMMEGSRFIVYLVENIFHIVLF